MGDLVANDLLDEKYRIKRLVGRGAWAVVYEATNTRIQRRVAIKVLNKDLADKPEIQARFKREASAATAIDSPYVVAMLDAGALTDGRPYIVMEFLEGENLQQRVEKEGTLSDEQAARYLVHALSGLADAHSNGVLHRDVKPENLVIVRTKTGDEIVKLVDFGISKPTQETAEAIAATRTDVVLGSPVYMSPEQARGARHMDHRSDLYSMGVVLYEMLTGTVPHDAINVNDLMFKIALEDPPDPRSKRGDIHADLVAIVLKALAREPDSRYQSAAEFRDVISNWLEQRGAALPASPYGASNARPARSLDSDARILITQTGQHRGVTKPALATSVTAGITTLTDTGTPIASSRERARRSPMLYVGLAVVALGLVGFLARGALSSKPAPAVQATASPPPSAETSPPAQTETPPATVGAASVAASSAPSASASEKPTAVAAPPPRPIGGRPLTPASTRASAAASTAGTVSAPTTTAVEGRTIHTTF